MADPPPQQQPQIGGVLSYGEEKLREASADLLVKREERGRDATTALLGQVAVVGSFLGAFSLLNDPAKAAVVQSPYALWSLVAVAISLMCSLSTYFLLPARMPSLDKPKELREFWNRRVATRRVILIAALIALGVAIGLATAAFADARDTVAPRPVAAISGKFTPSNETAWTLEATATWQGLDPGENVILCVSNPSDVVLGGAVGGAGGDGKQTLVLTVPVSSPTGEFKMTTVRLAASPDTGVSAASACGEEEPARIGTEVSTSLVAG